MRLARIAFSRMASMMHTGGLELELDLFQDMLKALPPDTRIVGFGEDSSYGLCYVMVTSKQFREVQEGHRPSEITAVFENQWSEATGYVAVFRRLDMSEALDGGAPCFHTYKEYIGVMERYNYCTKCGAKEKK